MYLVAGDTESLEEKKPPMMSSAINILIGQVAFWPGHN